MAEKKDNDTNHDTATSNDRDHTADAHPGLEVTPQNVQSPISDEDKDLQNEVLEQEHIEKGFPAGGEPRTDEERQRMKDAGLIQ